MSGTSPNKLTVGTGVSPQAYAALMELSGKLGLNGGKYGRGQPKLSPLLRAALAYFMQALDDGKVTANDVRDLESRIRA